MQKDQNQASVTQDLTPFQRPSVKLRNLTIIHKSLDEPYTAYIINIYKKEVKNTTTKANIISYNRPKVVVHFKYANEMLAREKKDQGAGTTAMIKKTNSTFSIII